MAFRYCCIRCGHEQEDHQPNLVNLPAEDGLEWIEEVAKGYSIDILECMETPWPKEYLEKAKELDIFCDYFGSGYTSPCLEEEEAEADRQPGFYKQTSVMVIYDSRRGGSVAIALD